MWNGSVYTTAKKCSRLGFFTTCSFSHSSSMEIMGSTPNKWCKSFKVNLSKWTSYNLFWHCCQLHWWNWSFISSVLSQITYELTRSCSEKFLKESWKKNRTKKCGALMTMAKKEPWNKETYLRTLVSSQTNNHLFNEHLSQIREALTEFNWGSSTSQSLWSISTWW